MRLSDLATPNPTVSGLILCVDGDLDMQQQLANYVSAPGFVIVFQNDGEHALDWLTTHHADLVLLEAQLGETDGFEVCRRLRKRQTTSELPIIFLSASGTAPEMRVRGFEAGANDFIAKPFYPPELIARIRVALQMGAVAASAENLLSRYVTRALRKQAALDPTLLERHEQGHAVVMFADLRGFTRLTANAQTAHVIKMLDEYYEAMMQVVEEHGGIVFDVVGDELMAVFNMPFPLPMSSYLAVQAAIEMQRMFQHLQRAWLKTGLAIGLAIGIHQGDVMIGNLGAGSLQRYTVIGNVVNLASRYVGLAKDGEIIISPEVYDEAQIPDDVPVTVLPDVNIKGISGAQHVYRLQAAINSSTADHT